MCGKLGLFFFSSGVLLVLPRCNGLRNAVFSFQASLRSKYIVLIANSILNR